MDKYLECEKLTKVSKESNAIGAFLDWLQLEKGVELKRPYTEDEIEEIIETEGSEFEKSCGELEKERFIQYNVEKLLAEYFGIDLDKVSKEKDEILNDIRKVGI